MSQSRVVNEQRENESPDGVKVFVDADRWIIDLDRESRQIGHESEVLGNFLGELLKNLRARSGHLKVCDEGLGTVICQIGVQMPAADEASPPSSRPSHAETRFGWSVPPSRNGFATVEGDLLLATHTVDRNSQIIASIGFDKKLDAASQRQCEEIIEAAFDLITPPCLRFHRRVMSQRVAVNNFNARLIELSLQGGTLSDTIAEICEQIANKIRYDRVAILRVVSRKCRLVATSTLATVDHRARQVRLMQALASKCAADNISVRSVHEVNGELSNLVNQYIADSGAADFRIDLLSNPSNDAETIAVMISEIYSTPPGEIATDDEITPVVHAAAKATAIAFARHENGWTRHFTGLLYQSGNLSRRLALIAFIGLIALLAWLPVELRVHVSGRLLPKVRQKVFSPVEGIVTAVHAVNGQAVSTGDLLVVIQSPTLDLARQQVLSEITTLKTRLASLLSARTRSVGVTNRSGAIDPELHLSGDLAASEETVKAQLAGLEEQLKLIDSQLAALQLTSSLDGIAMRWDINQTLNQRPVAAGQFLLEVIAADDEWIVELDVPEVEIGYVQSSYSLSAVDCNFRFRSNPSNSHVGQISTIDSTSQTNASGESTVRVIVPVTDPSVLASSTSLSEMARVNAGVLASIDCGKRPLIVVYTRGLVRWARVHLGW